MASRIALVVLLALSAVATTTATCPQNFPLMMGIGMMDPCMQSCMMQQPFTMVSSFSPIMGMGSMVPCMQSCMMQRAFTIGGSPLLAMLMQQSPLAMLQQQCCMQSMMQGMMSPQCRCGAMCQMMHLQQIRIAMQLPFMWNTAAMMMQPTYWRQPFPSCAC
ncbi:hypothetical protein SETIT_9G294900v2 [Setaria italica]|uniref:Bifunctional inhibitor/plant lipid transfer protein/seed storage helical domain-containing protein n=1 Tax=Setaria italica TaxID=4555 RepID=K4AG30_SETIT|nr:hypothetical protein SETIT_9G294900v2 [Setaria italica]